MESDRVTSSPHSPHDGDTISASAAPTIPDSFTTSQPILAHSLIRLIQCSHCLRPLRSPLRLPCGNTFCRVCLPPLHERRGITYPADAGRKQGFRCYWRGKHNCHGEHCVGDCGVDVLLSRLVDVFDNVLAHTATASDTSNEREGGLRMTWKGLKNQELTLNYADIGPDLLSGIYNLVKQGRFDYDATEIIYERALKGCSGEVDQSSALFERLKNSIRNELDCQVCYSLITDPLTTPCGHTFCRGCVSTVLDHSDLCPICRRKLNMSSTINSEPVNKRVYDITQLFFPDQISSQRQSLAEERSDSDALTVLPLFVNALSFPTMPTFLHIFEPRYRLMIRRVMESRDHKFGMVLYNRLGRPQGQLGASQFMQYGTVLRVERFEPLPDGRSLVFAQGVSRFKVIKSRIVDGYHVGQIQRVDDIPIAEEENLESLETSTISRRSTEAQPLQQPLDSVSTQELFQLGLDFVRKRRGEGARWLHPRVLMAYGDIPSDPAQFPWWLACVFPVSEEEKYALLSTTSVRERLKITAQWARRAEAREWSTPQSFASLL
ncbi:putative ATP-dependent protease [Aspergillus udagawae]|uniref:Putative ATP-dependent protease n=1 Tax=Aspergillus udagawae TaxID=91492 RepID=A0A8H3NJ60_9EURO|nr:putative ATP-dependent protease [Aspergillus udagawae]